MRLRLSKYLARIRACWGPEFEPSVEEVWTIDEIRRFSVCFLWRARTRGDFPYSVEHMADGVHVRLKLRPPIYVYTEHVQLMCPSLNYGGVQ